MPIRVTLDAMIVRKGIKARDLAAEVGLSETQLSLFRSGKVKGIRFRTLARLCAALECRPGHACRFPRRGAICAPSTCGPASPARTSSGRRSIFAMCGP